MQITTKYDVGDEVVYMRHNRIQKANVTHIATTTVLQQLVRNEPPKVGVNVMYTVINAGYHSASDKEQQVHETQLFRNAEELLPWLVEQSNTR